MAAAQVKNANGVFYTATSDPTLVRYKTTKRHHALEERYDAVPTCEQHVEFKLELGSEYVDASNSYLKFTFRYNTSIATPVETQIARVSSGMTDILRDILIVDRNGVTLERIENVYQIASMLATTMHTTDQLYYTSRVFSNETPARETDYEVIIPLHFLAGMFRTNVLLPPHIVGGATIRLGLRNANHVLQPLVAGVPDIAANEEWRYSIYDPMIVTESFVFDKRLHELVTSEYNSPQGLHFPFVSHTNITVPLEPTAFTRELQIRQPFSRATKVLVAVEVAHDSYLDAYIDNMLPLREPTPWTYASVHARIGDNTYPNSTLESPGEAWHLWINAFGKNRGVGVSSDARTDFVFGGRLVIDCNRGVLGGSSGVTINNKFPVVISLKMRAEKETESNEPAYISQVVPRIMQLFVEHERVIVATAMSHQVVV